MAEAPLPKGRMINQDQWEWRRSFPGGIPSLPIFLFDELALFASLPGTGHVASECNGEGEDDADGMAIQ